MKHFSPCFFLRNVSSPVSGLRWIECGPLRCLLRASDGPLERYLSCPELGTRKIYHSRVKNKKEKSKAKKARRKIRTEMIFFSSEKSIEALSLKNSFCAMTLQIAHRLTGEKWTQKKIMQIDSDIEQFFPRRVDDFPASISHNWVKRYGKCDKSSISLMFPHIAIRYLWLRKRFCDVTK